MQWTPAAKVAEKRITVEIVPHLKTVMRQVRVSGIINGVRYQRAFLGLTTDAPGSNVAVTNPAVYSPQVCEAVDEAMCKRDGTQPGKRQIRHAPLREETPNPGSDSDYE